MMKTLLSNLPRPQQLCIILITGLCALAFTGELALAAKKSSFRVGVIDPQMVIEKSKAGSRALAGLKEHAQARENVMKKRPKGIRKITRRTQCCLCLAWGRRKKAKARSFLSKIPRLAKTRTRIPSRACTKTKRTRPGIHAKN